MNLNEGRLALLFVPTLYVAKVDDLLGRVPLALFHCILDGNTTSTIPIKYVGRQKQNFEFGCADGQGWAGRQPPLASLELPYNQMNNHTKVEINNSFFCKPIESCKQLLYKLKLEKLNYFK
jgi:hypothetical protein